MRISDWSSDVCSSDLAWPLAADQRAISLPLPPAQTPLMLRQTGGEGPWATVSVSAAVPLTRPLAAGYQVKRKVSVVSQRQKGVLTRSDVLKVTIQVEATAERHWVDRKSPRLNSRH